ncbi:UNVERIFIED_CONTAM: hypothetical protein FKN15_036484 [Acipenser sinensis]
MKMKILSFSIYVRSSIVFFFILVKTLLSLLCCFGDSKVSFLQNARLYDFPLR